MPSAEWRRRTPSSGATTRPEASSGGARRWRGRGGVAQASRGCFRAGARVRGRGGISWGGGSGREPLHGGFVGVGMLDAACAGEVFTSPVPDQMLEATKGVDGGAGVLHIVKNYSGDVMNFEMAAELAAADTGVEVVSVVTADAVAGQDRLHPAGPPGVGVTVLVRRSPARRRRSAARSARSRASRGGSAR